MRELPKTKHRAKDDQARLQSHVELMRLFGNPQNQRPTIHVAGTSGKGTVCYLVDALLRAHTKKTGMLQSPHVYDIRERVQINGQIVSEKSFLYATNAVLETLRQANLQASYTKALTLIGFTILERAALDYIVLETIMGGRLDITNTVTRKDKLCVITRIGIDHVSSLGNTLADIAKEKAGIIQKGNHVIALRQESEINRVITERAAEVGASLTWVEQSEDYQITNDRIATSTCEYLAKRDGWTLDTAVAAATLQQVFIPGRFEKRHFKDHLVILDGAHNPQKLAALTRRVQQERKHPATIVFSAGTKKDLQQCLRTLKPIARRIIATEYFSKEQNIPVQPVSANTIATLCTQLGIGVLTEKNPQTALQRAVQFAEPIIVTGSFYLLGEVDGVF